MELTDYRCETCGSTDAFYYIDPDPEMDGIEHWRWFCWDCYCAEASDEDHRI